MLKFYSMKFLAWLLPAVIVSGIAIIVSCSSSPPPEFAAPTSRSSVSVNSFLKQINIRKDLIPAGTHARKYHRPMRPRYITIHSTQNYSPAADAFQHSKALKNGKLRARKRRGGNRIGYLSWHYSIDQDRVVQHIPDNEQGEHADFDGPGNNYSIGLEMCENRGNNRTATLHRTAKLAAYLMYKHNIPIQNIKAHYHWTRHGLSKPNKNCPHFLMDNGKPGAKWRQFVNLINSYHKLIANPYATISSPYTPQPTSTLTPIATLYTKQELANA